MHIHGIVVITGGASGIGAACSRYIGACGADIIIVDRDFGLASAMAGELHGRAYEVDIGDEKQVFACAARITAEAGAVDALVNCAGVVQGPQRPFELPMKRWDEITRVDQRGTYLSCVAFGEGMVQR